MPPLDDHAAVRRLLDRLGFGPRPGELDAAVARGFDATLASLLSPGADPGAAATPAPTFATDPYAERQKQDQQAKKQSQAELNAQIQQLTGWWLDRMTATQAPFTEKLTWFWHGHFATSVQKVHSAKLMLGQNETFRKLGAGDFAALAKAMIVDPAMLIWLDGGQNRKGAANENLAREFMELFTLGIGHYTETDVREGARALTGWQVNRTTGAAALNPKQHDTGTKTVLGTTGNLDANSLVDVFLGRPDSPKFIASRLWFRLVSGDPIPDDALGRLVAAYGSGRDVTAMVRALATEPAFRDSANALVKQPVEWLVGYLRAVGLQPSKLPAKTHTQLLAGLRGLGQVPFAPPSVGGWAAGGAWLSTGASLARLQVAQLVATSADLGALGGVGTAGRIDAVRALLGVDAWSDRTRTALQKVVGDPKKLVAVAACAPEYVVSA